MLNYYQFCFILYILLQFLSHITVVQKQLEDQIAQVHQLQEAARSKFSEDLTKSEAEMEASITAVLQDIRAHRDQAQLQELVKAEEQQTSTLLALKMEEFKNLRKADILGNCLSFEQVVFKVIIYLFTDRCNEIATRARHDKEQN